MTEIYFITGTDTDIGKTTVTQQLILNNSKLGKKVLGIKPVASGCYKHNNILVNSDGLKLQQASNIDTDYSEINPYRFEEPVSPHIANINNISAKEIADNCLNTINKYKPDICYIEGAGGWLCPLNNSENFPDIVKHLDIPVILVIGIKLGCLNHAMLSVESIVKNNFILQGWIANHLEPENNINLLNIEYLTNHINAPLLEQLKYKELI